jgi:PAS domain S-box-containing protein
VQSCKHMLTFEFVERVLDSAPDAMIIIDAQGTVLSANKQVTALFGHERDEVEGAPIEKLLPQRFRDRHVNHRMDYGKAVRVRPMGAGLELFGLHKDGREFPVEISLSPITHQGRSFVAAAIRDVSERKRVERALLEARHEADQANQAKSRFLATASHDLRQPLQTLNLLTGALRRMVNDPNCIEVVEEQEAAITAMSRLLNALLDVSKLESGAVRPEISEFPVAMLFEDMRREYGSLAASKGLRLTVEATTREVRSDPALIGQVLRNLVSNAVKYTSNGGVELGCQLAHEDSLRILVRDTGIGIAQDQLGLIYDEFYQVGVSPNTTRDGYGLGLSIVKRIARLLDIELHVRSRPGEGSEFSFALPLADGSRDSPAAGDRKSADAAQGAGRRVLLVEDEAGVRNAMKLLLQLEGFAVTATATAAEAVSALRSGLPIDLLVTDYHLEAGHTGSEVITAAREAQGAGLKAVLVTGDTSSAIRAMQADANLRIASKPINSADLLATIRALLQS